VSRALSHPLDRWYRNGSPALLTDSRVIHRGDEGKVVGRGLLQATSGIKAQCSGFGLDPMEKSYEDAYLLTE